MRKPHLTRELRFALFLLVHLSILEYAKTWTELAVCLKAVLSHWWVHYIIRVVYSVYFRMHDFAFISKLQEFVVLQTWTKNCAIQYCCVLCWCGMTWWWNWKSWFFSSWSSVSKMYVFVHFVCNFRFEPVLDEYTMQVISFSYV